MAHRVGERTTTDSNYAYTSHNFSIVIVFERVNTYEHGVRVHAEMGGRVCVYVYARMGLSRANETWSLHTIIIILQSVWCENIDK